MRTSRRGRKWVSGSFAAGLPALATCVVSHLGMARIVRNPRDTRKTAKARNCAPSERIFGLGGTTSRRALDLHARAELDDPVGGDVEVVGDVAGVARHRGEDAIAPERHADAAVHRHDLLPR